MLVQSFVYDQLRDLKDNKATGLNGIAARLLKDGASAIAKLIAYLINVTIRSGEIPLEWKEAKRLHQSLNQVKEMKRTIIDQSEFSF